MTTARHFLFASLTIRILYPFGLYFIAIKILEIAEVSSKHRIGCSGWTEKKGELKNEFKHEYIKNHKL